MNNESEETWKKRSWPNM